jgi:GNAT superfamily N-acetyltransferase
VTLRVAAFDKAYDLAAFGSGNFELDTWLRDHAELAAGQGTRTYVVLEGSDVAGYFAIAPHFLDRAEAPTKLARGAPRQIPSILLAKLALSQHLHGRGLGAELLVRALSTIVEAARVAGGKMVVVDAIDAEAAAFYRHHDFQALPNRPDRLVMKLSTAARVLGLDWP